MNVIFPADRAEFCGQLVTDGIQRDRKVVRFRIAGTVRHQYATPTLTGGGQPLTKMERVDPRRQPLGALSVGVTRNALEVS